VSDIVLICVNYHNDAQTVSFVRQVLGVAGSAHLRVVIASNNGDQSAAPIADEFRDAANVRVVDLGRNCGYFGAAELALQEQLRTGPCPDWVIVSNTDLIVESSSLFERFDLYRGKSGIGVIAPAIVSTVTGLDQNPFYERRPSALRMHAIKWAQQTAPTRSAVAAGFYLRQWLKRGCRLGKPEAGFSADTGARIIYAPHGSFIAFSKEYFARGGTLTHAPFLYGEEIMVAETARKLELAVVYDPGFRIRHAEHATTSRSPLVWQYQADSAKHCADTYFPLLRRRKESSQSHGMVR